MKLEIELILCIRMETLHEIILAKFSYLKRWTGLHLRRYFEFDACDKNIIFKVSSNRMIDSN